MDDGIEIGLSDEALMDSMRRLAQLRAVVVRSLPDAYDAKSAYVALANGCNRHDGRVVRFVNSTYGKIIRHRGYDVRLIIPQLKELFDVAVPIGFQPERQQPARPDGTRHKRHPNFVGYRNYLGKMRDGVTDYYVRFTVQEERTRSKGYIPNLLHSTFVSNVEIYKTDGPLSRSTASVGERERHVGFDNILAKYFWACKAVLARPGFHVLGISHARADATVRDKVAFSPETAAAFREKLAAAGVAQSMVLSTCNRCEVFVWTNGRDVSSVRSLFEAEFPSVKLEDVLEGRSGQDALVYLFRIAAGLESMVLGEYQILGQVKEAHAASLASGHAGKELDRILRDAVTCAKRVKTELDIGAVPPSVCRAGMEHVVRIAGLAGKRVFVIGSGRTGTLAAKLAKRGGARSIAVCNRSPERAQKLVAEVGATVADYAARYEQIAASDIVVSATASPHVVVCADRLRLAHPVVFLDLASPRDVEPSVAENPLATLVSIDTIGELASGDRMERERLTAKGMAIILVSVDETMRWLQSPAGLLKRGVP